MVPSRRSASVPRPLFVYCACLAFAAFASCSEPESPAPGAPSDGGLLDASSGSDASSGGDSGVGSDASPGDGGAADPYPRLAVASEVGAGTPYSSVHYGGSWFVGGQFERISTYAVRNLLTLDNTGTPAPCAPTYSATDFYDRVFATVQSPGFVYVSGVWSGAYRVRKIDLATCKDAQFSLQSKYPIFALAIYGNDLYAGGSFIYGTMAPEISANRIARINATTGAIVAGFVPTGMNRGITNGEVRTLAVDATHVYAGGTFTAWNGVAGTANGVAKIDRIFGTLDTTFSPTGAATNGFAGGEVDALALDGTSLYVGGAFTSYAGTTGVNRIAKLDLTGALDTAFGAPGSSNGFDSGAVLALTRSGTHVYAGGSFDNYRGVPSSANRIAKLDTATGAIDTTFSPPGATANGFDGPVHTIAVTATDVYVGGRFSSYKGVPRSASRFAKLSDAGVIDTTFLPVGSTVNGVAGTFNVSKNTARTAVNTIAIVGNKVWLGGEFTAYAGRAAYNIAKLSDADLTVDASFSADGFDGDVYAIAASGTSLYVGGRFTQYRGVAANRIAKLDATTGALDTTFGPPSENGFDSDVRAIVVDGADVFVGGYFSAYRGVASSANRIAKLDATTGAIDTAFSPVGATSNGFNTGDVTVFATDATHVYVGGAFSSYRGGVGNAMTIAKLSRASGAIDTVFSPPGAAANGFTDGKRVTSMALTAAGLYVGTLSTDYRGAAQVIKGIAKLDPVTGIPDAGFVQRSALTGRFTMTASDIFAPLTNTSEVATIDPTTGARRPVAVRRATMPSGSTLTMTLGASTCATGCGPLLLIGGAYVSPSAPLYGGLIFVPPGAL